MDQNLYKINIRIQKRVMRLILENLRLQIGHFCENFNHSFKQ